MGTNYSSDEGVQDFIVRFFGENLTTDFFILVLGVGVGCITVGTEPLFRDLPWWFSDSTGPGTSMLILSTYCSSRRHLWKVISIAFGLIGLFLVLAPCIHYGILVI